MQAQLVACATGPQVGAGQLQRGVLAAGTATATLCLLRVEGCLHAHVARPYINAAARRAWAGRRIGSTAIVHHSCSLWLHCAPRRTLCCSTLAVHATVYGLALTVFAAWELNPDDGGGSDRLPDYSGDASHGLR